MAYLAQRWHGDAGKMEDGKYLVMTRRRLGPDGEPESGNAKARAVASWTG
jgi:hypothetical protein